MQQKITKVNNIQFSKLNAQDYILTRMQQNIQNTFDTMGGVIADWKNYLCNIHAIKKTFPVIKSNGTYVFDKTEQDLLLCYDIMSGKYKCKTNAIYFIDFSILNTFSGGTWVNSIALYINNKKDSVLYYRDNISSGSSDLASGHKMLILNAGDVIELKNNGTDSVQFKTDQDTDFFNYFQMWFLC